MFKLDEWDFFLLFGAFFYQVTYLFVSYLITWSSISLLALLAAVLLKFFFFFLFHPRDYQKLSLCAAFSNTFDNLWKSRGAYSQWRLVYKITVRWGTQVVR